MGRFYFGLLFGMAFLGLGKAVVASDVNPFEVDTCPGPAMNWKQAVSRFSPGSYEARLGRFKISGRQRDCTKVTGCTCWTPSKVEREGGNVELFVSSDRIFLRLVGDGSSSSDEYRIKTQCSDVGTEKFGGCYSMFANGHYARVWRNALQFSGKMGADCLRLTAQGTVEINNSVSAWREIEWVLTSSL